MITTYPTLKRCNELLEEYSDDAGYLIKGSTLKFILDTEIRKALENHGLIIPKKTAHPLNACTDHTHMHKGESKNRHDLQDTLNDYSNMISFTPEEIENAVRLEIWHSLFTNPAAEDYSMFELYDIENNLIAAKKMTGY